MNLSPQKTAISPSLTFNSSAKSSLKIGFPIKRLLTGKPIFREDLTEELKVKEGNIAVFCEDKFIEVARIINEKGITAKPEFVMN